MPDPEAGTTQPLLASAQQAVRGAEHWTRKTARACYASSTNVATSAFFGLVTAFCLKTIGQSVAIALVLLFIMFQVLAYYGYVNFSWRNLGSSVVRTLDVNNDGRVNLWDVSAACQNFGNWAFSWGLPSLLGFLLGFYIGWHYL